MKSIVRLLLFLLLMFPKQTSGVEEEPVHHLYALPEPKLKEGDSAFDEIQEFNEELDIEHDHPPGMHLVEGDIMEDEELLSSTHDDNFSKKPKIGIPLRNNYHLEPLPSEENPIQALDFLHTNFYNFIKKEIKKEEEMNGQKRGVINNEMKIWRTRTIPYVIDSSREDVAIEIENGIREISSQTCLRFVKKTDEKDYLKFDKLNGCWSKLGHTGGEQIISIGNGCERKEIVSHEILHALGFYHEQNRYDRDKYIKIIWNNIKPNTYKQFVKATRDSMDDLNLPYDLKSVMHYGNTAYSKNSLPTILSKKYPTVELGNKEGLSPGDVDELNKLYKCDELPIGGFGKWNSLPCYDNLVRLKYRICYGQTDSVCEGYGLNNGLQVMRITCDRWKVKAYMQGCYNQKKSNQLPFQRRASNIACTVMRNNDDPSTTVNDGHVRAYRMCALMAYLKKVKKFGITNYCYCWFGDDDVRLKKNGRSKACKDGSGFNHTIFLYILEYRDEDKI